MKVTQVNFLGLEMRTKTSKGFEVKNSTVLDGNPFSESFVGCKTREPTANPEVMTFDRRMELASGRLF